MIKTVRTHTAPEGREELRLNAASALAQAQSVTAMLLCGQILTLLEDIDTLAEALAGAGVVVEWAGKETAEPRLGSNLRPMGGKISGN